MTDIKTSYLSEENVRCNAVLAGCRTGSRYAYQPMDSVFLPQHPA